MVEKEAIASVANSFQITGRGIVLELKHNEAGLKRGTRLELYSSGDAWEVKARIIFDHTENEQKKFQCEDIEFMRLNFKSPEDRENSIKKIIQRENSNTYEYYVAPISDNLKPENNERLKITFPDKSL